MNQPTIIISRLDQPDCREDALIALCAATPGVSVLVMPHIYHLPEDSALWEKLATLRGAVVLVSPLHPRPAEWLLRRHAVDAEALHAFNLDSYADARECFSAIRSVLNLSDESDASDVSDMSDMSDNMSAPLTPRWYPIIDKSRCVECQHCLQFCLFGVYTLEDGAVVVRDPDRCKPGCPACSRICPHGAIIFPLYEKSEAIAGAPGLFMTPDLTARKMFYLRTKTPCPRCGLTENTTGAGPICEECGRAVPQTETGGVYEDIDALIDAVDQIAWKNR